ncbi:MAG: DnaJ domain-containing protein [Treponema sp.]|nr:DnaJ domain-containing protein [Treponema sp.]
MNYYDVLRVKYNAHANEINHAFRLLAKKYHPDYNKNHDAAEKFIFIHEAYSVLKNIDKRKVYNESLYNNADISKN